MKTFWSVEVGQSSGGHGNCPSLLLPVAHIGPSDLSKTAVVYSVYAVLCDLVDSHPDMTCVVDWAVRTNYLSIT